MTLPPATVRPTEASLLDAFARQRTLRIEDLSGDALAGLLILHEGGTLNAALAVKALAPSHFLQRAVGPLSLAQDTVTVPTPIDHAS